ncbi:hypothetical protein MYAM1_003513 [Malassezia yamatoensis]|uniref:DASH complex subunit DUO1 n=1 Tax=Malassezia yamatoensis TaxID=253288 RepID=A0AAJ5YWD9_9BASI|nr:hypothetical protein MYAM1_003513 [Malassezia yamatoensis]
MTTASDEDSLFGQVLHADAGIQIDTRPEDSESAEQVQRQVDQLQQLQRVFSSYESVLAGGVDQMQTFAERVHQTDRLLDMYVDLLRHAQSRRQLLSDPDWHGATHENQQLAAQQRESQRREASASMRSSQRPNRSANATPSQLQSRPPASRSSRNVPTQRSTPSVPNHRTRPTT